MGRTHSLPAFSGRGLTCPLVNLDTIEVLGFGKPLNHFPSAISGIRRGNGNLNVKGVNLINYLTVTDITGKAWQQTGYQRLGIAGLQSHMQIPCHSLS